ncbi:MAG: hypothetical protein NTY51_03715 [Deltaproteobacteria bacterium]|nr:hypothetical protein [Deltaproteobacteria bacterium]
MALRVVAIFAFLTTLLLSVSIIPGIAGGPPAEIGPFCAPAPQPCAPPTCGPTGPPSPFGICGAILGACTNICGTVIGIPSAVMAGILAPAPRRPLFRSNYCAPAPCGPPPCPPPTCGPVMPCGPPMCAPPACVPTGITKCKPPRQSYMRYGAVPNPSLSPYPMMMVMPATALRDLKQDLPGGLKIVASLMEIPLNMISGSLVSPRPGAMIGSLASSREVQPSLTGQYW